MPCNTAWLIFDLLLNRIIFCCAKTIIFGFKKQVQGAQCFSNHQVLFHFFVATAGIDSSHIKQCKIMQVEQRSALCAVPVR